MPRRKHQAPKATATKPIITTPNRYVDWVGCIGHLRAELAANKICLKELRPYQSMILSELEDGPCEQALASMHDWSGYDLQLLLDRGGRRPAQPRIDLTVLMTTKDNLAIEWAPSAHGDEDCDWKYWHASRPVAGRPTNELLFIRDLGHALTSYRVALAPCDGRDWQKDYYAGYRRLAGQVDVASHISTGGSATVGSPAREAVYGGPVRARDQVP